MTSKIRNHGLSFAARLFMPAALLVLLTAGCGEAENYDEIVKGETVTVTLTETAEAFPNPMKGFRPSRYIQDPVFPVREYVSVCKHYIKYTDLEYSENDTAQKIIDWSNKAWEGIEKKNMKVIPRVVIVYPNGPDNGSEGYWPEGIRHNDPVYQWLTDPFKRRLRTFIAKLGEAWDDDPRVAAVEIGLWGNWGEHHIHPLELPGQGGNRIPEDFQKAIGDAFVKAFKNKKLMVRYPETFTDYDFGYIWDSFALPDDEECGKLIIKRKKWKTQMISGEVAYNWGDQTLLGGSPDGTLSGTGGTDYVIDWIKRTHASSLGWIAEYDMSDPKIAENAARMQKAFGYRYVINKATYTKALIPGEPLSLTFEVSNVGSAPFYYQWPVEVSLLDQERGVQWRGIVHVDIRKWNPGRTYTVTDSFTIPEDLPRETYTLALAVLDPSGNVPSLRFANTNYYTGGRTPLGRVGIGREPDEASPEPFDSLYDDHTLFYTLDGDGGIGNIPDTQVYEPEPEEVIEEEEEEINSIQVPGNLAYQKPVEVSSTETQYDNYAPKAVDGDPATRWSSEWEKDPSWISVDLGQEYLIDHVNLSWEWSYAKSYQIQVSADNENWTDAYSTAEGKGEKEEIRFDPVNARYVRMFCTKRALQWGYSLYEIEVFEAEK